MEEHIEKIRHALGKNPKSFVLCYENEDGMGALGKGSYTEQLTLTTYGSAVLAPWILKNVTVRFEDHSSEVNPTNTPPEETL